MSNRVAASQPPLRFINNLLSLYPGMHLPKLCTCRDPSTSARIAHPRHVFTVEDAAALNATFLQGPENWGPRFSNGFLFSIKIICFK